MDFNTIMAAFGLTLLAGLSTGIGSALILFTKKTNTKFLSLSLGFSAGVMIYVSFMEILPSANSSLIGQMGKIWGSWVAIISFFGGIVLSGIVDRLVPLPQNPHEVHTIEKTCDPEIEERNFVPAQAVGARGRGGWRHRHGASFKEGEIEKNRKLLRLGYFTAIVIALHNIPEGLATFITALKDPKLGVTIAIAIAIHNIPEGITVAVPIFCATGNRKKAFFYSFLSGFAELFGALLGYLILLPFMNDTLFGIIFALVAGIMVFISFDELLPAAREYGEHHLSIYGLILGMLIMAISLVFM